MKIHNYIIAKTGMHLRPGGIMAMVVTHRFLDTANPEARDALHMDFRFPGAIRLPNDAFGRPVFCANGWRGGAFRQDTRNSASSPPD